jgi:YfiH family protein
VRYDAWMDDARIEAWQGVPGLVHGFGRRPPQAEAREATRARVAASVAPFGSLQLLKQVHGTALLAAPWDGTPEADAGAADRPGLLLGIETADCQPILFIDARRHRVAAAHAGWRGTAAGIAREALAWLQARGASLEDVQVALGPSIGACCYEVGDDLRAHFGAEDQGFFEVPAAGRRPHLDVRGVNERQIVAAGVPRGNVFHVRECTSCRPDLYCSYRREGTGTGRMISYVGWAR